MSDPVKNVEIEDVLSSIRKLVSEDARAAPVAPKPEKPGRLVLTPAQRVKDDVPPPQQPVSKPVLLTQPIVDIPVQVGERAIEDIPGTARLAEFGNVEGAFPDIDDLVADEARGEAALPKQEQPEGEDIASRGALNRLIEQEVTAALGSGQEGAQVASQADDEEASAKTYESFEEDWAALTGIPVGQDNVPDSVPDASTGPVDDHVAVDVHEDESAYAEPIIFADPEPAPLLTLEDKVAALGRLVARDTEEFEEERDRPDADDLAAASEPMEWPDAAPFEHVEDEDMSAPSNVLHAQDAWPKLQTPDAQKMDLSVDPVTETVPEPVALDAPLPSAVHDDATTLDLDEDMLRALISEIVRQELQGALGERITRNVRKLVRREIHRMLISQQFD
ncbi:MAG: hypothetical protein ACSHXH_09475 [Marivita sp.]|uniref:hypothetical protein n=1 Tax=Marivita sp. TaxID=2003365 RepID=UPI003EF753DD